MVDGLSRGNSGDTEEQGSHAGLTRPRTVAAARVRQPASEIINSQGRGGRLWRRLRDMWRGTFSTTVVISRAGLEIETEMHMQKSAWEPGDHCTNDEQCIMCFCSDDCLSCSELCLLVPARKFTGLKKVSWIYLPPVYQGTSLLEQDKVFGDKSSHHCGMERNTEGTWICHVGVISLAFVS